MLKKLRANSPRRSRRLWVETVIYWKFFASTLRCIIGIRMLPLRHCAAPIQWNCASRRTQECQSAERAPTGIGAFLFPLYHGRHFSTTETFLLDLRIVAGAVNGLPVFGHIGIPRENKLIADGASGAVTPLKGHFCQPPSERKISFAQPWRRKMFPFVQSLPSRGAH